MNCFTFVTITYNHEAFIIDHLESIKKLIKEYSGEIHVDYVLSDDCSRDQTLTVARKWLNYNRHLFNRIEIIENEVNKGTVSNFISAVKAVKTNDFKLLAGDDLYGDNDIFSLMDSINNDEILVSPTTPFGENAYDSLHSTEIRYRILMHMAQKGKLKELMQIDNFIPAPGVFLKKNLIIKTEVLDYIKEFKYCEDYPMYYHLIVNKDTKVRFLNQSLIYYRIGAGVSTSTTSEKRSDFVDDLKKVRKKLGSKCDVLPKYINPYKYYIELLKLISEKYKEETPIHFMKEL